MGEENLPLYKIYRSYCDEADKKMDYDSIRWFMPIPCFCKVLELQPFPELYPYISVDEPRYIRIQYEILKLSGDGQHLFMVGDEHQRAHGFSVAYPSFSILGEHPSARASHGGEFPVDKHIVKWLPPIYTENRYRIRTACRRNAKTEVF